MIAAAALLFAFGHVIRDGWPALGSTHAARALGAVLCGLGAGLATASVIDGAAIGAAVLAGFYLDSMHGEGQQARDWRDLRPLVVSGLTSVLPLAVALIFLRSPWCALLLLVGLVKPGIWFAAWRVPALVR